MIRKTHLDVPIEYTFPRGVRDNALVHLSDKMCKPCEK